MLIFIFIITPVIAELPADIPPYLSAVPKERTIFLHLPLQKTILYWKFVKPDAMLDGKLILTIDNGQTSKNIVVFADGKFSPGWYPLFNSKYVITDIFFSTNEYVTSDKDKVSLEWVVKHYLRGQSESAEGIVVPGKYVVTGRFTRFQKQPMQANFIVKWLLAQVSGFYRLDQQQEVAYINDWSQHLPIILINDRGFMPKKVVDELQKANVEMQNKLQHS